MKTIFGCFCAMSAMMLCLAILFAEHHPKTNKVAVNIQKQSKHGLKPVYHEIQHLAAYINDIRLVNEYIEGRHYAANLTNVDLGAIYLK